MSSGTVRFTLQLLGQEPFNGTITDDATFKDVFQEAGVDCSARWTISAGADSEPVSLDDNIAEYITENQFVTKVAISASPKVENGK